MSSEHATEQVPLADIQEGDTIQDPKSDQWFTVTRTADGTTSVTQKHADGDRVVPQEYRVYFGDERQGEQVDSRCLLDSRFTKGLNHAPGARVSRGRPRHGTDTKIADLQKSVLVVAVSRKFAD